VSDRAAPVLARLAELLPPGAERDEVLELVRIGLAFRAHQAGRHPGFLYRHVAQIVERLGPRVTFDSLVSELQLEASRRDEGGAEPVERCSRSSEVVTYHDPRHGRRHARFGTLRNLLTRAKREARLKIQIHGPR
jgi:hypothetical protein